MQPDEPLAAAMAQASYYARRAGYLEGALLVISWGTSGVDPQEAAARALEGVGEDEYARRLKATPPAGKLQSCPRGRERTASP